MVSARLRLALAGALLLAALLARAEDSPLGGDGKMPREPDRASTPDEAKPVPTKTITLKEYQDLLDKVAAGRSIPSRSAQHLQDQGPGCRRPRPSACRVRVPDRRRAALAWLSAAQAYPTDAKMDNHPPSFAGAHGRPLRNGGRSRRPSPRSGNGPAAGHARAGHRPRLRPRSAGGGDDNVGVGTSPGRQESPAADHDSRRRTAGEAAVGARGQNRSAGQRAGPAQNRGPRPRGAAGTDVGRVRHWPPGRYC